MSPKKCLFFVKETKYLGHIIAEISKNRVKTDPEKIRVIQKWKTCPVY